MAEALDLERTRDRLERYFAAAVAPNPRRFGTIADGHLGVSDGHRGVQWNAWVNRDPPEFGLGVNLEGLKYDDWPIARFIQRELVGPGLFDVISEMNAPNRAALTWFRDYWKHASRPKIRERYIVYRARLDALHPDAWHRYLLEAQGCLNASTGSSGRARQRVTLATSGRVVEGWVSPHLHFAFVLDPTFLQRDLKDGQTVLGYARRQLKPLYSFVERRAR
jgi:hypothetical protein